MKYANHIGWSDINPYEVIRKVSEKCLEVREMKAELDPGWKPEFVPGGFVGTVVNQSSQKWLISPNPAGRVERIRLGKKGWKGKSGRFVLRDEPVKFYDYNF